MSCGLSVKGQSDCDIAGSPRNIFKYDFLEKIYAGTALIAILSSIYRVTFNWGVVKTLSLVS